MNYVAELCLFGPLAGAFAFLVWRLVSEVNEMSDTDVLSAKFTIKHLSAKKDES